MSIPIGINTKQNIYQVSAKVFRPCHGLLNGRKWLGLSSHKPPNKEHPSHILLLFLDDKRETSIRTTTKAITATHRIQKPQ